MKLHANAPLGPKGRATMVSRVLTERTAGKWVRRYRAEGEAGLLDLSSAISGPVSFTRRRAAIAWTRSSGWRFRQLAADPGIELSVIVAGRDAWRRGTQSFLETVGAPYEFVPFHEDNVHHGANSPRAIATFLVQALFQFPFELQSLNQGQVESAVGSGIESRGADLLLVDYLASALFVDLPRRDARTAIVKHNREADFYAGLLEGGWLHGSLTRGVSLRRLARVERRVDAAVGKVIVIAPPDLPKHPTRSEPVCIPPVLERPPATRRFTDDRSAFFAGNIHHALNRAPIEWLARELAPRLLARRDDARIVIVGADEDSVPAGWRQPNVEFRGYGDESTVEDLLRGART